MNDFYVGPALYHSGERTAAGDLIPRAALILGPTDVLTHHHVIWWDPSDPTNPRYTAARESDTPVVDTWRVHRGDWRGM